jgi:hypothetical protein
MITFNLTSLSRISYIYRAVAYYDQTLVIAAPYLEPGKEQLLKSAFAQIKNRDDYAKIILSLQETAKRNAQHVPPFDIW